MIWQFQLYLRTHQGEFYQFHIHHEAYRVKGFEAREEYSDMMLARVHNFKSPNLLNAEFHAVRRYYKITRHGLWEHFIGFEGEEGCVG